MTDWPVARIDDYRDRAEGRFTSLYSHAEKLKALADIFAGRMQAMEDVFQQLLRERWVDNAVGQQLDEMGAIVGEPRLGRTDEFYRPAIEVRIILNRAGGEPESLIRFIDVGFGADVVAYQEIYPAKIEVYTRLSEIGPSDQIEESEFVLDTGDNLELDDGSLLEVRTVDRSIFADQLAQIRAILAAGVGVLYFTETDTNIAWGTVETGVEFGFAVDTGDDLELSDGATLEIVDQTELDPPAEYITGFSDVLPAGTLLTEESGDLLTEASDPLTIEYAQRDGLVGGTIAELFEVA